MDRIKYNDKETEIIKDESKESCGLIFPLQDSGELSVPFFLISRALAQITRSSHQDLLNCCQYLGEYLKNAY